MKFDSIAYLIVFVFFAMDFIIRKGAAASMNKTKDDKHSTRYIILAMLIILISAEISGYFDFGYFRQFAVSVIALFVMLAGLGIRIYSMLKLKDYYTRTLVTTGRQELIRTGLYKHIRHPGYLGTLLVWLSFGIALHNYIVAIIALLTIVPAYVYRIRTEEKMLAQQFGQEYINYQKTSWRLLPYIW